MFNLHHQNKKIVWFEYLFLDQKQESVIKKYGMFISPVTMWVEANMSFE